MNRITASGNVTRPGEPEKIELDFPAIFALFLAVVCVCGRAKQYRRSFCYNCFCRLTAGHRKALWLQFGNGYERAYLDGVEAIIQAGKTTAAKVRELAEASKPLIEKEGRQ